MYILMIIITYLLASIPNALWIGKTFCGIDLRTKGSGNLGSTNASRFLDKKYAVLVLITDMLKGAIPLYISKNILNYTDIKLSILIIVAILGHSYPIYLKFKGGKSVAIMLGVYLAIFPKIVIFILLGFVIVELHLDYIALASIAMSVLAPIFIFIFYKNIYYVITGIIVSLIIIYRHKTNIVNLINKTEQKYRGKK